MCGFISISPACKNAFTANEKLCRVYFADRVKTVGSGAFTGCSLLETVELSQSLEVISESMFENCDNLVEVNGLNRPGGCRILAPQEATEFTISFKREES